MRFYVRHYKLEASNPVHRVREMGSPSAAGVITYPTDFSIQCELIPILDAGESVDDILNRLALWLNGSHINMVQATPDRPRCFYCGEIHDSGKVKCPNCDGGTREDGRRNKRL